MKKFDQHRKGESGNVLFLILIAVALFAALSYAVTQSTRSSGGDAGEKSLVNSAQLTQYPAGVRTSLVRMIIGGTDVTNIEFNQPSAFGSCSATKTCVFHPSGGNATYVSAPPEVMASGTQGTWYFNANYEIPNIGTSGAGGNDLIAFLPGILSGLCSKVNEQYGISSIVTWDPTDANITDDHVAGDTFPATAAETFDTGLSGQPFGCFQDTSSSDYVYYHVLIER